jgi:hypothetical protein
MAGRPARSSGCARAEEGSAGPAGGCEGLVAPRRPAGEGLSAGSAVVPPSGFSPHRAGLCLMLEYARDSPSHRYTRAHTRTLTHAHAPLFADRAPVALK